MSDEQTSKKTKSKKPKSITIQLSEPIEWGEDETITEIVLTRPKGKHLKSLSGQPTMKDLMTIAQKVSGHPPRVFDDMDADDVMNVVDAVSDFLDSGQETGKKVKY